MLKLALLIAALGALQSRCTAMRPLNPYAQLWQHKEPPLKWSSAIEKNAPDVEELWLPQPVDHFAARASNETWQMRYLRNAKYYQAGGPIFIFVGGEWEISGAYLLTGFMYDLARQHAGMLYYTEHRHYGQSWPRPEATADDLQHLSVRQALADLRQFISAQRESSVQLHSAKVILVGGSYAGSMVAWFMRRYPGVASAAWASSAPMYAKLDYYEYMELVGADIRQQGGKQCYEQLVAAMADLARSLQAQRESQELLARLRICRNFNVTRQLDVASFFNGIGNHFAGIVQAHSAQIGDMCLSLSSLHADPLQALIKYLHHVFWSFAEQDEEETPALKQHSDYCLDFNFEAMRASFLTARSWFYQTCSEFGWYSTTATHAYSAGQQQREHPFGRQVPLHFFQQLCQGVFGDSFTLRQMAQGVAQTNTHFALNHYYNNNNNSNNNNPIHNNSNNYERVFFTHGALDPWRAVGRQTGSNVIIIPGYSHTADLGSLDLGDSVALNVAKLKVAAFLRRALRH